MSDSNQSSHSAHKLWFHTLHRRMPAKLQLGQIQFPKLLVKISLPYITSAKFDINITQGEMTVICNLVNQFYGTLIKHSVYVN